jgi:hypothetical protein
MPSRAFRYSLRAALALGLLHPITACDQWAVLVNSDGVLSISIVSDGFGLGNRFRVRARQADGVIRVLDVPPSGKLMLGGTGDGPVELTLLAPGDCRVSGLNPRTVSAGAHESVNVVFDVDCRG